MSVEADIRDHDGNVLAHFSSLTDFQVQEDSTPLDASDSSGGVGSHQASFSPVVLNADHRSNRELSPREVKQYRLRRLRLTDAIAGLTIGDVDTVSGSSAGPFTVTAQNKLNRLNVVRRAKPFSGSLDDAITYYLSLVKIVQPGTWIVEQAWRGNGVVLLGWYANVWTQLKKLCVVQGLEMALVDDVIQFRGVRERTITGVTESEVDWSIDDSQLATAVEVTWYRPVAIAPGSYTPSGSSDSSGGSNTPTTPTSGDGGGDSGVSAD